MADSTQHAPAAIAPAGVAGAHLQFLLRLNNLLQFLTNCAWYIGTPFIPLYLVAHGASVGAVGAVAGLSGVAPLAVALHVGGLVDERGPTVVLVGSVGLFGLGAAMLAAFSGILEVAIAFTLLTAANIGLAVASQAVVAGASTPVTRIRNYGYYAVSYSAGAVVGPVIGGFLAARLGYTTAFAAMALLMVPSFAVASMVRAARIADGRRVAAGAVHTVIGTIVRERGVGAVLFVSAMMNCAQALQSTFYPLYLSHVGLSVTLIGIAIAAISVASMAVRMLLARAVAQLGQTGALVGAIALSAVALAATPFARQFWPLLGVSALMGASLGFTQPLSMSLLAELVAQQFWGAAFGIRQSVQRVASVVSPFVFGAASAARGLESAFYLGALVLFGAAGVTARMAKSFGHRPDS
ncbi:MAG TPA: MFS transporter [bacterium]|nr:MFS transporter [bacterium]